MLWLFRGEIKFLEIFSNFFVINLRIFREIAWPQRGRWAELALDSTSPGLER